jgi:hypothetical protein
MDVPRQRAECDQRCERRPEIRFTKADTSGKVAHYFDLSYLAEATGQSVEQLGSYGR